MKTNREAWQQLLDISNSIPWLSMPLEEVQPMILKIMEQEDTIDELVEENKDLREELAERTAHE